MDTAQKDVAAPNDNITTLTIDGAGGDRIDFSYRTLRNNRPSTYSNTVFIWQNTNEIPWNQPFLNKFSIQTDTQSGSGFFADLDIGSNDYILGYGVGADVSTICSTAYIPANGSGPDPLYEYFQTTIEVIKVGSNSVSLKYTTPAGYTPKTNKNWVGMWEGSTASYTIKPKWISAISSDGYTGSAGFNAVSLRRGFTYTIAYFMSGYDATTPKQTAMAAVTSFTV